MDNKMNSTDHSGEKPLTLEEAWILISMLEAAETERTEKVSLLIPEHRESCPQLD